MQQLTAGARLVLAACSASVFALIHNSAWACDPSAPPSQPPGAREPAMLQSDLETGEIIDPDHFLERVIERYRTLGEYQDTMHVVEVTEQAGREVQRRESDVQCEITGDGELRVRTPTSMLLNELGVDVPMAKSPLMQAAQRRLDLWLAPHLGLRYLDNPLKDFREGVKKGFTAKSAKAVKVNDRPMVHIELASDDVENNINDGADASFDIYVDPRSMLVERIEGRQQFDDGSTTQTTHEISPRHVRDDRGAVIRAAGDVNDDANVAPAGMPAKSADDLPGAPGVPGVPAEQPMPADAQRAPDMAQPPQ